MKHLKGRPFKKLKLNNFYFKLFNKYIYVFDHS